MSVTCLASSMWLFIAVSLLTFQDRVVIPIDDFGDVEVVEVEVFDSAGLQNAMDQRARNGGTVRIGHSNSLVCTPLESLIDGEVSRHALLIPSGIELDLNGCTLLLDLCVNSHGVRLSNRSAIRNGTIKIIRSENRGSQAIWHAGVGIGAPYDDGGTPAKPGHFSKVSDWKIENMIIDQQFSAAAIQIMSEACHGVIRDVQILDSSNALVGIGMDWGSVGKIMTADETIPRMRKQWEQREIYSTHPHDILLENINIGHLTRNIDGNNAGVRCSACYNIQIRSVHVASAASAVSIFGGDCGFEFAPEELRPMAHTGYTIHGVVIDKAFRYGIVLNGLADNVFRSSQAHGYQPLLDATQPGLFGVRISNCRLIGDRTPDSCGMFVTAVSHAEVRDVTLKDFATGVRIKDWIDGLQFRNTDLSQNDQPRSIFSSSGKQNGVIFDDLP